MTDTNPPPLSEQERAKAYEVLTALQNAEAKQLLRGSIVRNAGDTQSLLGTTADGVQLLLLAHCQLIAALSQAKNLAEVRAAASTHTELATSFLAKVKSGEVRLPFMVKGMAETVTDIENRATAVFDALESSRSRQSADADGSARAANYRRAAVAALGVDNNPEEGEKNE